MSGLPVALARLRRRADGHDTPFTVLDAYHVQAELTRLRALAAEPDVPATLSEIDDVAKVAEAYGLDERTPGPGWVQWRQSGTFVVLRCYASPDVEQVALAGEAAATVYRPVSRNTVIAAIQAARGAS